MISEQFLNSFTYSVIKNMQTRKPIKYLRKEVINADMIPSVPESAIHSNILIEKQIQSYAPKIESVLPIPQQIPFIKNSVKPIQPTVIITPQAPLKQTMPAPPNYSPVQGDYGQITPLLIDPMVTLIECNGAGENITIIHAGQKQFTKISLTQDEIKAIIEKTSEKARIPLIEGVFKAAVDNFIINAVVSSVIGNRFVIKKTTPYSLLDQRN